MREVIFINDGGVKINTTDDSFSDIFSSRVNSEKLFRILVNCLIKNKVIDGNILDSGAWIGDNAIPWAKQGQGIVYAIDPSDKNCDFIKRIAKLNNISNIVVLQNALSGVNKTIYTNDSGSHRMYNDVEGSNKVESVSLDHLHSTNIIKDIGFIHLDVEGMEKEIILGTSIIDNYRPIVSFEQHIESENFSEICYYLEEKNYRSYIIDESFQGCRPDCRNLLSIPNHKSDIILKLLTENSIIQRLIPV
jgi:FkbM family methyltransferase